MVRFTVIIATFNRVGLLRRAVYSVLTQEGVDLELIVVDDGSTDETPSYLATINDPRLQVVRSRNRGACAARNVGIILASGEWITLLDDDDIALPGWLLGFHKLVDDRVGILYCGAEVRAPDGSYIATVRPEPMGELFQNLTGSVLAGTFAVRKDVLRAVGGYDDELRSRQQTDLALRLAPELHECGLRTRSTQRTLIQIERRDSIDRPMADPDALYSAALRMLEKHSEVLRRSPHDRADLNAMAGVNAARLGYWAQSRSALRNSLRADPKRVRRWLRLVVAHFPPIARRVWRASDYEQARLRRTSGWQPTEVSSKRVTTIRGEFDETDEIR